MLRSWSVVFVFAVVMLPEGLLGSEQRARLELRVEQKKVGVTEVVFRGVDIMTRVADLQRAGIDTQNGRTEVIYGVVHVSLKSLARIVDYQMDDNDLVLALTVKPVATARPSPIQARPNDMADRPPPIPTPRASDSPDFLARLALYIDGQRKGEMGVVVRDQEVFAGVSDIEALGAFVAAEERVIVRGIAYVSLRSLSSRFTFTFDQADLSLRLASRAQAPAEVVAVKPSAPRTEQRPEAIATEPQDSADQRAIFAVKVNTAAKGDLDLILRGEDVLVRVRHLRELGMVSVNGRQEIVRGESYVSLRSLAPIVSYVIDHEQLAVDMTFAPEAFGEYVIAGNENRPQKMEYREDTSGFINYAVNARNFNRIDAFSELGLTIKNALVYSGLSFADAGVVRGISNVTVNNQENTRRFVVGDRLVNSDSLGGSITMAGLSYFRDFTLDPYYIRNPGINYSGAVSIPSTLDVYSNGILVRRVPLPPGQFQLRDLPLHGGSNNTRFVLRDTFGREREVSSQFYYFTSGLLKSGLHDFSYNFGSQRQDLDSKSWGYGQPVFLANHRYGFTDYFTAGLRFEGTKGLVSGGPSMLFLLPLGEMELAGAASSAGGAAGGAGFLGYSYISGRFSFGSSVKLQTERYANTSFSPDRSRPWLESSVSSAFALTDNVAINLRYGFETSRHDSALHRWQFRTSTSLGKYVYLFADAGIELRGATRSLGFATGLSISLNGVTAGLAYVNDQGRSSGVAEVRKNLPFGPGYGYGFQAASNGDLDSVVQYQTSFGRYDANYRRIDGRQESTLSAAGGLAYIDGNVSFSRPVENGFALIRLPGLPGIRGYLNNLEVGTTDKGGRLFVPNMLSYYGNRVSISRKDLPLNYNSDVVDKIVAVPYRGGVLVDFPVARIQRVTGKVVVSQAGKTVIPKHGQLTITAQGKSAESPLGNSGEFYFENPRPGGYQAMIEFGDASCQFSLDVPQSSEEVIQLGTLPCEMH
jgi:outer membrane usher protein